MTQCLRIDIHGYWHPGTGRGKGSQLDALTHRGADGLPRLPGRTVRGLVRDAVNRWERFGGYDAPQDDEPGICDQLFGPYDPGRADTDDRTDTGHTWPGLLRFSDAQLRAADRAAIDSHEQREALIAGLYRSHFSTRIEYDTGTADENTLRGIELVVPLTLYADIDVVATGRYQALEPRWPALLREALPLVRAVGAHRSRGLGRATLTLEDAA